MEIITVFYIVVAIIGALYLYVKWAFSYWRRHGLENPETQFFYGNIKDAIKGKVPLSEVFNKIYREFKSRGLKHAGFYMFFQPVYMPIDNELIKCILQKDFDSFVNHGTYLNEKSEPLTGHLFNLEDDKWRNLRAKLTPTFTTGKLKMMFETLISCTLGLKSILDEHAIVQDPVDIKDVVSRFTTDIIGSCGFGIDCNSLKNPDSEFRKYGDKIFVQFGKLANFLITMYPKWLITTLGLKQLSQDIEDFYIKVVEDTVKYRETHNIHRKDFMHLLLQLKNIGTVNDDENITNNITKGNNSEQNLSMKELTAQCFVFFAAGFETSATTMTFALLELTLNLDIQEKLREEITVVLEKYKGKLTYDAVMDMKYLDKIIYETLRKHTPAPATTRVCNKQYQVPGTKVILERGTRLFIPIDAIHNDPDYYPEPRKFDPERFSEENKAKRPGYTFLAFGEGPRLCIGARFGMMQAKVGLICMIKNFRVSLNEKTQTPIKYAAYSAISTVDGNVWLNVTKL